MQELKINYETEQPTVSARALFEGLEISERFSKWFDRMSGYGFEIMADYTPYQMVHPQNHQEIEDYKLSIDMAKQICMIQRSEKGKQYRQYFLDLEKAWNTPEQIMARALKMADEKMEALKNRNVILLEDVERMKPKEIFADAVSGSEDLILIRDLAKLIKQNGLDTGERRLIAWMKDNGYIIKRSSPPMPTQKAMDLGVFRVIETIIVKPDGTPINRPTTKVTGKGQQYFINKFLSYSTVG